MSNNYKSKLVSNHGEEGGDNVTVFSTYEDIEDKLSALEVKVVNNFDRALKAFRALVQKDRILSLYKESTVYEKPTDKKRRKRAERIRKLQEMEMKKNRPFKKKKKEQDKPKQ